MHEPGLLRQLRELLEVLHDEALVGLHRQRFATGGLVAEPGAGRPVGRHRHVPRLARRAARGRTGRRAGERWRRLRGGWTRLLAERRRAIVASAAWAAAADPPARAMSG